MVLAWLGALEVVVEAAIAFGWFSTLHQRADGLVIGKNSDGNVGHGIDGTNGMFVIALFGLALPVVSFLAAKTVPRARTRGAIVFGAIVLQVLLAFLAFSAPVLGVLHGINALVVLGTAMRAGLLTREPAATGRTGDGVTVSVPRQRARSGPPTESPRPA